jgi:hypothetical protein
MSERIERSITEIDYASELGNLALSELGNLALSDSEIIKNSKVAGTLGSRQVFVFSHDSDKIYFFADGEKIDALLYLRDNRLLGMKNFSKNSGLIFNLFQFILNIKKQKIKLLSTDQLTADGLNWIVAQAKRSNGFSITDQTGKRIDPHQLNSEWEQSRITGKSGPTSIVIGESKNSKQIFENETRLMPMDIFGATLKESYNNIVPNLVQVRKTPVDESNIGLARIKALTGFLLR